MSTPCLIFATVSIACLWMPGASFVAFAQQNNPDPQRVGVYASNHFDYHYAAIDADIAAIAAAVEAEYGRVMADLEVKTMPRVTVTFFTDHKAMEDAAAPVYVPRWAGGLAISDHEILMMSPNLKPEFHDRQVRAVVHEFAHCVSLRLNPNIANNPRWFWETVAVYEERGFHDPHALSYMTSHQPPTLEQLNDMSDTRLYDVAYLIGEFVVTRWGRHTLHELILNNADTKAAMGMQTADFERQWFAFVQGKYGI